MLFKNYKNKIIILLFVLLVQSVNAQKWKNLQKRNGLIDNYVKKVFVYKDELWVGTPSGVSVYNLKNKKWKTYNRGNVLPDNFVNDIFVDNSSVWIATVKGLAHYDKKKKSWSKYTKKNGLSDNFVTSIYADKENYWFGTRYWGVSVFSRRTKSWTVFTSLDGLAGNKINCINGIGDEIWFGTKDGISQLRYYEFIWKVFTSGNTEFGLARDSVISLTLDGDDIWCGTEGEGICKYNSFSEKWIQFNTGNKLMDDFILSIKKDGEYIWVGSFGGISLFQKYKNAWNNFGERKELPEPSISSIAVDGDYVWFGTAGGGITRYKKEKPQVQINHTLSGYSKRNIIKLVGTIYDYDGIDKINISYRKRNQNQWFDKGISIKNNENIHDKVIAEWNTQGLLDGEYIVKIDAFDNKAQFNSTETIFKIDTIKPIVYLDQYNKFVKSEEINITGSYFEDNLVKITLMPQKRNASVDKLLKTFAVPVKLKKTVNKYQIKAYDIAGQITSIPVVIIKDKTGPKIRILNKEKIVTDPFLKIQGEYEEKNIDRVMIQPFDISADLDYQNRRFSKTIKLEEGRNKISCVIYDKAGNQTQAKKTIDYKPEKDPVVFNNYKKYVSKKKIVLKGKIALPGINKSAVELNDKTIDLKSRNKNISIPLSLKEGQNFISITLTDKEDRNYLLVKEIICDTVKPSIDLSKFSEYVKNRNVKITIPYIDKNINTLKIKGVSKSRIIHNKEDNTFSASFTVKRKKTPLFFFLTDKAGNRNTIKKNIILDNQPPRLIRLDYPTAYNFKQLIIKGSFLEQNPDKIEITQGKIIQMDKKSFQASVNLKEDRNRIKLSIKDKAGFQISTNLIIRYDNEKPEFSLSDIPDIVKENVLKLKGTLDSDDINKIIVNPGKKRLSIQEDTFSGIVELNPGDNLLEISAYDYAGNMTQTSKNVYCQSKKMIKSQKDIVVLSKKEYEKLKKRKEIIKTVPDKQVKKIEYDRIKLPKSKSLVLAPYQVSKGDSLWKLSTSYYGSSYYADYIQKFNELISPQDIKSKERIFIPTLQLIKKLSKFNDKYYIKALSLLTLIHYNYGYYSDMRKYSKFLSKLLHHYGYTFKKIFGNYNIMIILINEDKLLIISKSRADINKVRKYLNGFIGKRMKILLVGNYKNKITCNMLDDYVLK